VLTTPPLGPRTSLLLAGARIASNLGPRSRRRRGPLPDWLPKPATPESAAFRSAVQPSARLKGRAHDRELCVGEGVCLNKRSSPNRCEDDILSAAPDAASRSLSGEGTCGGRLRPNTPPRRR